MYVSRRRERRMEWRGKWERMRRRMTQWGFHLCPCILFSVFTTIIERSLQKCGVLLRLCSGDIHDNYFFQFDLSI